MFGFPGVLRIVQFKLTSNRLLGNLVGFVIRAAVCMAALGLGCQRESSKRIEYDIRGWREHPPLATSPIGSALQSRMLNALNVVKNNPSLQPRLGAAIVIVSDGEVRLLIYWIEESPTIESVVVLLDGHKEVFVLPDVEMQRLKTISDEGDLSLYASLSFPQHSAIDAELRKKYGRARPSVNIMVREKVVDTTDDVMWLRE